MNNLINIICIALLLTGCEKVVDLTYKSNSATIIIEGNITNQPGPYFVKITKSAALTHTESFPTVDDAVVSINDNAGNGEMLIPMGNGMYRTNSLAGIEGRTYTLDVKAENRMYTARSTMPQHIPFDSVRVLAELITGETEYSLIPVYGDPFGKGNNYRFMLRLNDKLVNQHFIQTDAVRDGVTNSVRLEVNTEDLELKPGVVVTLEMQCIDKSVAQYYTTLALMGDSGPGGGTTPNNPPNNISNGALGLFSAHTVQSKKAILP